MSTTFDKDALEGSRVKAHGFKMKRLSIALVAWTLIVAAVVAAAAPGLARGFAAAHGSDDGLGYTLPVRPIEDVVDPGAPPEPPRRPVPPFPTR